MSINPPCASTFGNSHNYQPKRFRDATLFRLNRRTPFAILGALVSDFRFMAKTDSTAINELIHLVQNKQASSDPDGEDPYGDLFSVPKPKARMSSTLRGASEIEPL